MRKTSRMGGILGESIGPGGRNEGAGLEKELDLKLSECGKSECGVPTRNRHMQ